MAWVEDNRWATKEEIADAHNARAPNPAEFPEPAHGSRSYWIREFPIEFEKDWINVNPPEDVDIAIIGSGISGAAAIHHISKARPDLKIAMFEARGICTGATGRNGGHVGRPEVYNFRELEGIFGTEEAVAIRRMGKRNFEMMKASIEELNGVEAVDLNLKGTMIVFEHAEERQAFIDDMEAARKGGLEFEGYVIEHEEAQQKAPMDPNLSIHGAAYLARSGTIYARKFVALLLKAALEKMDKFSLHPYTPVWKVQYTDEEETHKYTLATSKGKTRARTVLHATNAYASYLCDSLVGENGVFGCGAHMLALQPNVTTNKTQLDISFGYADFWHWVLQRPNLGPYLYGLATGRYMGDFNDNLTIQDDDPSRPALIEFMEKTFPRAFQNINPKDITYDWKGVMGLTNNGASFVGRPKAERRGEFASVGHNGEGMGRGFIFAFVIAQAVLAELEGRKDWTPPEWFPNSFIRNLGPQIQGGIST
ncbi:hypothetical protein FOBRF1_012117 [Fusarium oxysporum]